MARTDHHRKPGAPRTPPKQHLACGRAQQRLLLAMALVDDDSDTTMTTFEPTHERRTRASVAQ